MTEEFISLLGPEWKKELADLKAELADAARMIVEFNKNAKIGELNLVNAKGIGDAIQKAKELEAAQKALQQAAEKAAMKAEQVREKELAAQKRAAEIAQKAAEAAERKAQRDDAAYERRMAAREKAHQRELSAIEKKRIATEKADEAQRQADARAAAAVIAPDSMKAMARTLAELRQGWDRLTQAERENEHIGGVLKARIMELDAALKASDASTGRFQRNVGNYTGAVQGFRMQFQQVARELPSLANGLQTFFMAIGNNVPMAVDALRQLKEEQAAARAEGQKTVPVWRTVIGSIFSWQMALLALLTVLPMLPKLLKGNAAAADEAEKAQKRYTESLKQTEQSARSNAAAEIAHIQTLTQSAANVELSMKVRLRAVKELQETYPSYFGNLSQEAILAGNVADEMNRATKAIIAKSMATASEKKLALTGERFLDIRDEIIKANEDVRKANERFQAESTRANNGYVSAANETNALTTTRYARDLENKKEYRDGLIKQADELLKAQKGYANAFKAYSEDAGNMMIEGSDLKKDPKTKPAPDYTNKELAVEQQIAEAQAKLRASQIQQDMEANKLIYEDETKSYEERLLAAENFNSDRLYQLDALKAGELGKTQAALDKIAQIEGKAAGKRTKEEKGLLLRKGEFEAEKQEITERYTAEEEKANREAQQRITALFDAEYSKRKAALATNLAENSERISEQVATEIEILAQRYAKGNMTESAYRAEAARIRNNYHVLELQDQLALVDAEIANRKKYLKDAADLEKQAADIRKKINEEASKANIAALEIEAEARRALYSQIGQLARSVGDAVVSAIDAGYQRQMDQLESRKKGIQSALEVELAAIEATTAAGVAREEKIAIAKAQAADKEKQIDAEREAIENRRKDLNRIVQAAAITGQAIQTGVTLSAKAAEATAQAALLAANPLTAAYAPVALAAAGTISAQIPLVAGIAAAQIAALYAYKEGTDDHPVDGLAIVGDGYRKEVVQTPDGKTYLTPDRPTITFLPQHTKVFSSLEDYTQRQMQAMAGAALIPMPVLSVDVSGIRADLQSQTAALTKAIRDQRPVILKGHDPRFDAYYYRRARA